jgi:hypothetical protein
MQATGGGNWPINGPFNWIEDVFSTWLYTGNGSTQTITNGIDLAGEGGLVWIKNRNNTGQHYLSNTETGVSRAHYTNTTGAMQDWSPNGITAFNSDGFSITGADGDFNLSARTYASWTFRKQPKFFDVVTYTGDDNNNRQIPHSLGSVPGCFIIKRTDTGGFGWVTYHRSLGNGQLISLQSTAAASTSSIFNNTSPTSTDFTVNAFDAANRAGGTYVAYLFAHNAGGFGLTGTDNVISCGSWNVAVSGALQTIDLGYEPQWLLIKRTNSNGAWFLFDNMRGVSNPGPSIFLNPNSSDAESSASLVSFLANGFSSTIGGSGETFIYIAIRRGPMKVPTDGTSVFQPRADASAPGIITDFVINAQRAGGVSWSPSIGDRLRGSPELTSSSTAAEATGGYAWASMTGLSSAVTTGRAYEYFRRAPGFFDVVCYTGTGSARTVAHNLGVAPEMIIHKSRTNTSYGWITWHTGIPITSFVKVEMSDAASDLSSQPTWWLNSTLPTTTNWTLSGSVSPNEGGQSYVAYLFASCPGVSKVGSYTGTGATQVINCGFTGGARFVLIKATSTTGNWLVWDSARGIVAGNDPYLALNSTAAEVTNTDWVDTAATGFELSNAGGNLANSSGVSYIFLAIA